MMSLNDQSFHRSIGVYNEKEQRAKSLFKTQNSPNISDKEKVWKNDAEGGFLSHSKMIYEQNQN